MDWFKKRSLTKSGLKSSTKTKRSNSAKDINSWCKPDLQNTRKNSNRLLTSMPKPKRKGVCLQLTHSLLTMKMGITWSRISIKLWTFIERQPHSTLHLRSMRLEGCFKKESECRRIRRGLSFTLKWRQNKGRLGHGRICTKWRKKEIQRRRSCTSRRRRTQCQLDLIDLFINTQTREGYLEGLSLMR